MNAPFGTAGLALTTMIVAAGLLTSPSSAHTASTAPPAKAAAKPTPYLFGASGFASRVVGGDVPAGSDRSAFAVVGCTNMAGKKAVNSKADVQLLPGLRLDTVSTRAWTSKKGGTVAATGVHRIERVVITDTLLGKVRLEGVESRSRAWHNGTGFHSRITTNLADIVVDPVVGDPYSLGVPLPGETLDVLGLVKVSLGDGTTTSDATRGYADADALKIELPLSGAKVFLAHSRALLTEGVRSALFRGSAYAARADVLDGVVTSGKEPNVITPCQGTDGRLHSKELVDVDVSPGVTADVPKASTRAGYTGKGKAYVDNKASLARVDLGGGLRIAGVVAHARITEKGRGFRVDTGDTTTARITLDGERLDVPANGKLEIPGLAEIRTDVVHRTRNSVRVTAVQVTLLDGRLATIDLATAKAALVRSGL